MEKDTPPETEPLREERDRDEEAFKERWGLDPDNPPESQEPPKH